MTSRAREAGEPAAPRALPPGATSRTRIAAMSSSRTRVAAVTSGRTRVAAVTACCARVAPMSGGTRRSTRASYCIAALSSSSPGRTTLATGRGARRATLASS